MTAMLAPMHILAAGTEAGIGEGLTTFWSVEAMLALITLTILEIVLGVDNVIVISLLSKKLPPSQSDKARYVGLALAMGIRILLLLSISWIVGLTAALFSVPAFWTDTPYDAFAVTGRDLVLIVGGLFLIWKSIHEIHGTIDHHRAAHESVEGEYAQKAKTVSFAGTIVTILLMDIVFSLDSVITAVGMVQTHPENKWVGLSVMIVAVMLAVLVMLVASGPIADFVDRHVTVKMLALAFLLLIGIMLLVDGFHGHVPRGYVYFAMAFSLVVELLNLKLRKSPPPAAN